jgi:polar amino acid transport system substrate-binding protein
VIGRSAFSRAAVLVVAAVALGACLFQQATPSPTPTPTPSAEPTRTRPRFELSTYEYALQTKGKIRIAVRDDAAPLSSRSGTTYQGFEPDIGREIARAIWGPNEDPETHIEWISVDPSTRVSALTSNQADITLAAIVIGDDAKKAIDLSDTYLKTGQRLLVKKTNDQIKDLADVASGEQTVCAVKNSAAVDNILKITNSGAKILQLETLDFCLQALSSGAADAITADELTLLGMAQKDPSLKIVVKPFTDDRLGVGIKKTVAGDRTGFLEFVNNTLLKIVADRTWAKLYAKYLAPVSGDTKQIPTD